MKILFVTSEAAPFAKAGGLGDVSAALPRALRERGHDVRIVLPLYRRIREMGIVTTPLLDRLELPLGPTPVVVAVDQTTLPGSDVPVMLVRAPELYDRPSIYCHDGDEHVRFSALAWASLMACQHLGWAPDIVHANDWPGGLLPLTLRAAFGWDQLFDATRSVLTIHNIGHQGVFDAGALPGTGLASSAALLHQGDLAAERVNFLLHGILHADAVTTVSPTYSREICTPEHGAGLDPFLRERGEDVVGILNGVDGDEWDPRTDPHLPAGYGLGDLTGKAACTASLQETFGLPVTADTAVVGIVSRLVWQKGFDLCERVLPDLLAERDLQLVILGTGEARYEALFAGLAGSFPDRVAFHRGFSEPLAHLVEAGSDLFLMPSRYEPCGLNQMYSLAYGTPPIAHRTGGLADTVTLWNPEERSGNGFLFDHFDDNALRWALGYALDSYDATRGLGERAAWEALQHNGMSEDHGWGRSVDGYERLYTRVAGTSA